MKTTRVSVTVATAITGRIDLRVCALAAASAVLATAIGCAAPSRSTVPSAATQPAPRRHLASGNAVTTRPAGTAGPAGAAQPGAAPAAAPVLDVPMIVQLIVQQNPYVLASRAEMVSAAHALEEFRADLSRLEPYADVRTNYSDYPNRNLGVRTAAGEAVGGIEKETFEGAVFRIEGGGSASRTRAGSADGDGDVVDEGAGGLLRGRVEVPFVGSRRRQSRIISQAFQESQARAAKLNYLSYFSTYLLNALSYYSYVVQYKEGVATYEEHLADLRAMLADARVATEDRSRIQSVIADIETRQGQYATSEKVYLRYVMASLGLDQSLPAEVKMPEYQPSDLVERASTPEGIASMVEEARRNTPTFGVLEDAVRDAELQRSLAVQGTLDITAFVEGTTFPFGAETFDDRFDGWTIGGGVTVRVNDQRVLTATRRKAEANIEAYRARENALLIEIERQVVSETEALRDDAEQRTKLLDLINQKTAEYKTRLDDYLKSKGVLIDQVLASRIEATNARIQLGALHNTSRTRQMRIEAALGYYYQMAGLSVSDIKPKHGVSSVEPPSP